LHGVYVGTGYLDRTLTGAGANIIRVLADSHSICIWQSASLSTVGWTELLACGFGKRGLA
jgi:ABC-type Fe3+-siderophore transport system permease subunit